MKSSNKTARLAAILVYLATIAVTAAAAVSEVDDHSEEKTGADPDGHPDSHAYGTDPYGAGEGGGDDHGSHPVTAILFPWFAEIIGVLVFFVLSRYCHALPYTAIMFLVGMFMGIGVILRTGSTTNDLATSVMQWVNIDGHVLLLVFLPGLLFKDAFEVNFHLFRASFWQLLTMAFPMVLAGTCLVALIGFYVFPYSWSFSLAMTLGSILAATDPVAVSALLNEVGAPPRLKMHVSGESLLNDGSAVVFYSIFSSIFLAELGIQGLGEEIGVGQGFAIFFKMSLGGAAIGIGFGLALLLLLFLLRRRLDNEENVVQVSATLGMAYLTFYVAEIIGGTSGVIAVVACGIMTQAFGSNLINSRQTMDAFWHLLEHLLNTLLFALAGVVFGAIVADSSDEGWFASDWGWLILLCLLLTVIRFFLVFSFYPVLSRIGLKSNWRECFFISFGGLRGAVGIALALALDAEVYHATEADDNAAEYRTWTTTLFGMVGGVAFFTLVVNGSLSGPLLHRLGLAASSATRQRIVQHFAKSTKDHLLDDLIHLLTDPRFKHVDFSVIAAHVPILGDVTLDDLAEAVEKNKASVPPDVYKQPDLSNVLPYLLQKATNDADPSMSPPNRPSLEEGNVLFESYRRTLQGKQDDDTHTPQGSVTAADEFGEEEEGAAVDFGGLASMYSSARKPMPERQLDLRSTLKKDVVGVANVDLAGEGVRAIELRLIFIEALRHAYAHQVERGELDGRGFVDYVLFQSLDFSADAVSLGKPLNDWEATKIVGGTWTTRIEIGIIRLYSLDCRHGADVRSISREYITLRFEILKALAFISAHTLAQERFKREFCTGGTLEFSAAERQVLEESDRLIQTAKTYLGTFEKRDVTVIVSHLACQVLLNKGARYLEHLADEGLLKQKEANHFIELTGHALSGLKYCSKKQHPGELTRREKLEMMALPSFCKHSRNLHYKSSSIVSAASSNEKEDNFEQENANAQADGSEENGAHHRGSASSAQ